MKIELKTVSGLSGSDFATLVFMASDAKIATAVRDWIGSGEHPAAKSIGDDPETLIDCAVIRAEFSLPYNDVQLIIQRVEVLAAAHGILLPAGWQVIY